MGGLEQQKDLGVGLESSEPNLGACLHTLENSSCQPCCDWGKNNKSTDY